MNYISLMKLKVLEVLKVLKWNFAFTHMLSAVIISWHGVLSICATNQEMLPSG